MGHLHLPHLPSCTQDFSKDPMMPIPPAANLGANKLRLPTLLKPSKQKVHAMDSTTAKCNTGRKLGTLTMRCAVSGLFHARKRSERSRVPSHSSSDGSGDSNRYFYESGSTKWVGDQEDSDTDASDCSEEEKTFFADLRRVRKGELISSAKVGCPHRSSISHVLGLFSRKVLSSALLSQGNPSAGGAFSTLLRKAKTRTHDKAVEEEVGEEQVKGAAETQCGGGGLCEKKVLMGRRIKREEPSNLGFLMGGPGWRCLPSEKWTVARPVPRDVHEGS